MKNISVMQLFRNSMDLTSCLSQLTGTRQTVPVVPTHWNIVDIVKQLMKWSQYSGDTNCYSMKFPFRSTLPNIPCNGIRRNRWPRSVQGEVRRQHEWRVTPSRGRTLRHPDSRNQASAWELVQTQERGYVHKIPKQWSGPAVFSWP